MRVRELLRAPREAAGLPDALADVAIHSRDARAEIVFRRGASRRQFLDGVLDNLKRVGAAGVLPEDHLKRVVEAMPRWFSFLEGRRVREGDRILYSIRGDELRTRYLSKSGETLLDLTGEGPEHRLAVLGSYFVRGSDFRAQLLDSARRAVPCSLVGSRGPAPGEPRRAPEGVGRTAQPGTAHPGAARGERLPEQEPATTR
jgi:hypothetical protein